MYQQVYPLGRHFFVLKQKNEAKKIQDYICFPQKIYTGFSKMLKPRFLFINKKLKQKAFLTKTPACFLAHQIRSFPSEARFVNSTSFSFRRQWAGLSPRFKRGASSRGEL